MLISRILALIILVFAISQANAQDLFADDVLHELRFTGVDTAGFDFSKTEQIVDLTIDGNQLDSVSLREKGNISLFHPNRKRPFKVKTNRVVRGQKVNDISEFTLHNSYEDPSLMREKLSYDLAAELGLLALRTSFAKVYINDVYWGVYTLVEAKDELFERALGDRDSDAIESLDLGTMCYLGPNGDDYRSTNQLPLYELENGDDATAFQRFANMIDAVNNSLDADYLSTAGLALNLDDWFAYQAFNVFLLNADSYLAFYGNQVYAYDSTRQQWQVVPWDFNASIGLWDTQDLNPGTYPILPRRITTGCVANKAESVPELRQLYLEAMCKLSNNLATSTRMNSRIDTYAALIDAAVRQDWRKDFSNAQYENALGTGYQDLNNERVPGLKTFFAERSAFVTAQLQTIGFDCSSVSDVDRLPKHDLRVYPNPVSHWLNVSLGCSQETPPLHLYDARGIHVRSYNAGSKQLDLSWCLSGVYTLRVADTGEALRVVVK